MPGDDDAFGLSLVVLGTGAMTVALVVGLFLWDKWRELDRNASRNTQGAPQANEATGIAASPNASPDTTSKELEKWLRDDSPICGAEEDLFGHKGIAKRIADRLANDGGASAIAVIGGFGSGKTSVRNLTIEQLETNRSVLVVSVSAYNQTRAS